MNPGDGGSSIAAVPEMHAGLDKMVEVRLKASKSYQLFTAKSLSFKLKEVRFEIEKVKVKIKAIEICHGGNSADVADSTNIHVQTYKSFIKPQLIAAKRQLRDEKSKLRKEANKLLDLLIETKENLLQLEGEARYLAFLERLLLLNLKPCCISLRPSLTI